MFSIVAPIDDNRLEQFKETKRIYDSFPQVKEFIMPTRTHDSVLAYLKQHKLTKDVKLIPYTIEAGFNPTKALNIGVRNSTYANIIVTGPEVKPKSAVLEQLSERLDKNVICQVFDEDFEGKLTSLVNTTYRSDTPQPYFLGMFLKKDIEAINGWDEDFMLGYAYEDTDFGQRWVRAGLPFEVRDEIQAIHQYHPRTETIRNGATINFEKLCDNKDKGIIRPANGLALENKSDVV